ncbi:phosphatidylserine decarboxylase family protein [soil metagenome]
MVSTRLDPALDTHMPPLSAGVVPVEVQPGGGTCVDLEAGWGRLRRGYLRALRPGYVRAMLAKRQGECRDCAHDIIDPRDLKLCRNVCGFWFRPEDDRFQWRGRLRFARYGLAELVISLLGTLLLLAGAAIGTRSTGSPMWWLLAVPAAVLAAFALWFFRDPARTPCADADALLSPADGVVTHIDEVDAPGFPGGRAARISIYLSPWNVHLNRMPRRARFRSSIYFRGEFLNARHRECVTRNEQLWVDLEEPGGRLIRLKLVSGKVARRLVCWLRPGEELAAGDRFGMIKFGSRTDVLVAVGGGHEMTCAIGDVVFAGLTVLMRCAERP